MRIKVIRVKTGEILYYRFILKELFYLQFSGLVIKSSSSNLQIQCLSIFIFIAFIACVQQIFSTSLISFIFNDINIGMVLARIKKYDFPPKNAHLTRNTKL